MPVITRSQTIHRVPAEVFKTIVTLDEFPRWNPSVKRSEKLSKGAPADGSRFAF